MEDLLPIIVSALIVIGAIFNAGNRKKKTDSTQQPAEAWPDWKKLFDLDEESLPKQQPATTTAQHPLPTAQQQHVGPVQPRTSTTTHPYPSTTIQPHSFTSTKSRMDTLNNDFDAEGEAAVRKIAYQTPKQTSVIDAKRQPGHMSKTTEGSKQETKAAPTSLKTELNNPQSEIIDDFDLRKAVIYSEIMKPKFDEE